MFPGSASLMLWFGFPLMAVALVLLVGLGYRSSAMRKGIAWSSIRRDLLVFFFAAFLWQSAVSVMAWTGQLARLDSKPPAILFVFFGIAVLAMTLFRSPIGITLAEQLPLSALVGFHAFRFPLELLMHQAATEGIMPPQMTFTGFNFDIVTGISAIGVAALVATGKGGRRLVIAWNAMGTVLLFVVVSIAVASSPLFAAFGTGAGLNTFVAYYPFTTLPTVMVLFAFVGHLLLWKRLQIPETNA